jgi:hypothetical protein
MIGFAKEIVVNDDLDDPINGADSFYSRKIHPPAWTHHSHIHLIIGAHVYVRQRSISQAKNEPEIVADKNKA